MPSDDEAGAIVTMRSRLSEGNALFVESANTVGIVAGNDPVRKIVMQLGALGYRQSELIASLAERPGYLAQIMQLVRGLLEAWWRAAWLTQPKVEAERRMRAVGLLQEDVVQREQKIDYQNLIVEVATDEVRVSEDPRSQDRHRSPLRRRRARDTSRRQNTDDPCSRPLRTDRSG